MWLRAIVRLQMKLYLLICHSSSQKKKKKKKKERKKKEKKPIWAKEKNLQGIIILKYKL